MRCSHKRSSLECSAACPRALQEAAPAEEAGQQQQEGGQEQEGEEQPTPAEEAAPPAAAEEEQAGVDADMADAAAARPEEVPEAAEATPAGGALCQLQAGTLCKYELYIFGQMLSRDGASCWTKYCE